MLYLAHGCCCAGDAETDVREAARRGLRAPSLNRASQGPNRRSGALAEADRNDLGAIARRSDVHQVTGSAKGGGSTVAAGAADDDETDPALEDVEFAKAASLYPLFSALVRFLSSPPEDVEMPGVAAPTVDGEWEFQEPSERVSLPYARLTKRPRLTGDAPGSAELTDRPDPFRLSLGPIVTQLPSMALAAALEFVSVCLDASACVAGVSPSEYIVALDEDEVEGLR